MFYTELISLAAEILFCLYYTVYLENTLDILFTWIPSEMFLLKNSTGISWNHQYLVILGAPLIEGQ